MPEFSVVNAEIKLRAACETFLAAPCVLLQKETIAAAMADEPLRLYFGRTLQHELMPLLEKQGREEAIVLTCRMLENKAVSPLTDTLMYKLIENFRLHIVPALSHASSGLCFSFACLIMLFSGAKRLSQGYEIIGAKGAALKIEADPEALQFFSRLSCDMPSDSLSYAVLSDVETWGKDLRSIDGFADMLSDMLRDLQILGPDEALKSHLQLV